MTKTRQWTVATAVAVLVVFAAGWLLLIKPQRSHASDLKSQAVSQQQANQLLQTDIASLLQEQKSLPEQQRILQKFSTQVPDTADEPGLIRQFSDAANGSGVDLVSLTPGTPTALSGANPGTSLTPSTATAATGLTELPVSVAITGNYANIESFFQAVEKLPRATLVSGWTLGDVTASGASGASSTGTTATDSVGTLTGTVSANVFYSAPPAASSTTTTTTPGAAATASPAPTQ